MMIQAMEELGNKDETPLFKEAELWIDKVKVQTTFLNTTETTGLTGAVEPAGVVETAGTGPEISDVTQT